MKETRERYLTFNSKLEMNNFYYLSLVVAVGVFLSIIAFIFSAEFQYKNKKQAEASKINSIHYLFESQLQNQKLHLDIIKDLTTESLLAKNSVSLARVKERLLLTKISCLYLVDWDDGRQNIKDLELSVQDTYCRREFELDIHKDLLTDKSGLQLITLHNDKKIMKYFVFKYSLNPTKNSSHRYLLGFLPIQLLLPMDTPNVSISVKEQKLTYTKIKNQRIRDDVTRKTLFIEGKQFVLKYESKDFTHFSYMLWPWIVLFGGFFLTGIFSYFYYTLLAYSSDISRRVKTKTKELELATKEAIKANSMKSKFLAGVSHDVRTPLNLMLGMAELLQETELDCLQKEYVQNFERAGNHLLDLINGVLDIARIESGEFISNPEKISLPDFIVNTSRFISGDCRRRKINYSFRIHPNVPKSITIDQKLLREVLINLLHNSIKFTQRGEISLEVLADNISPTESDFIFRVKDTGEGMPSKDLDIIFEAFQQGEKGNRDLGVGLGLSIVKSIVDHLGGSIEVNSRLGMGTVFEVRLRIHNHGCDSWLESFSEYKESLNGKVFFLYCESEMKTIFLQETLEYFGSHVAVCNRGSHAVDILKKNANTFDYILVDVVNSSMGGLELIQASELSSQALSNTFVLCPLVHRDRDHETIAAMGLKHVIYKPVYIQNLIKTIVHGDSEPLPNDISSSYINKVDHCLNLLVAEDDMDNRNLIEAYLKNDDINIYFANDGQVAYEKYRQFPQSFDLVITDLQMPNMDGFQLIAAIRKLEDKNGLPNIPLLVLTADAQPEQVTRILKMGANDYMTKPIRKNKLREMIIKFSYYRAKHQSRPLAFQDVV